MFRSFREAPSRGTKWWNERGACGSGLASRASGGPRRHRPAQLCGSVRQRAGEADESGGNPVESRAVVNGAPVRFQKAVPGTKEKRRGEAPIGAPARVMGRPFPSAEGTGFAVRRATGCGDPHQRLSALRHPSDWGGHSPKAAGRTLPRSDRVLAQHDEHRSTTRLSAPRLRFGPSGS